MTPEGGPRRRTQPWKQLAEQPRTGGWLPVVTRTYQMPDGSTSDWDIHDPPFSTTVGVLALTPDEQVVMTRQFRPGPGRVLVELPGGIVDEGESVVDAAARELLEETGFAATSVDVVGACWAFGASTWRRHVAVARGCHRVGEVRSWGGDEYCEPVLVSVAELRRLVQAGETTDTDLVYLSLDAAGLL